jgi:hypothetical protein
MEPQAIPQPPTPPIPPITPTPQVKNSLVLIMSILLIVAVAIAGLFYFQIQKLSKQLTENKSTVATSTPTPIQTSSPVPTLKPGWRKYINEKYNFEFTYPEKYKVLTDSTNLYGWPKAILLLYKGGQSYDMAVEVWDSEAEYKQKYNSQTYDFSVFKTNSKFITLLNTNKDAEVTEVISSFKFIEASPSASPTSN